MSASLQESALLVKLTRHSFSPRIKDIEASKTVNEQFQSGNAASVYKELFKENGLFKRVYSKLNEIYSFHMTYTLPWLDRGVRILPSRFYEEYMNKISEKKEELNTILNDLKDQYDAFVTKDKEALGTIARDFDYPTFEGIRSRFGVSVNLFPIPDGGDFRVEVSQAIKDELDDFVKNSSIAAKDELMTRVRTVVDKIIENYSKDKPKVYDSHLENLNETAEIMGILNIHGDPDVEQAAKGLKELSESSSTFRLRNSAVDRKQFLQRARGFVSSLSLLETGEHLSEYAEDMGVSIGSDLVCREEVI